MAAKGGDGMKNIRTNRILLLFHLFYHSEAVSFREMDEYFQQFTPLHTAFSHKTYQRDMQLLSKAGILSAYYMKEWQCYVPEGYGGRNTPLIERNERFIEQNGNFYLAVLPKNETQRKYMKKIIRLCTLMIQMVMAEVEDPIQWYREKYPRLSDRTRQRDFNTLREIGYQIEYVPKDERGEGGRFIYRYPVSACEWP